MKLISVTCPSCGSNVEVDEYSQSFTCKFCNVTTIIEKDSYNTNYNDDRIKDAELLIHHQNDYMKAMDKLSYITDSDPQDPRPWLGLIRCLTYDFSQKLYIDVEGYSPIWLPGMEDRINYYMSQYRKLEKKPEQLAQAEQKVLAYINACKNEYEELLKKYPESKMDESIITNYDTTINASNKIISSDDIRTIVDLMNKYVNKYRTIAKAETKRNQLYDYKFEEYTYKEYSTILEFDVDFYDNTESKIDNYDEFIYVFNNRLNELKEIRIRFYLSYYKKRNYPEKIDDSKSQSIRMTIRETKVDIDTDLDSKDRIVDEVYNCIKNIVVNAPEKYDDIVRKKLPISLIVGFGVGFIPGILIALILMVNEVVRQVYFSGYVTYPLIAFAISFVIAQIISFTYMESLYKPFKPEKEYAGYKNGNAVYKDDIDKYVTTSEVLIGKNYKNLINRNKIKELYSKFSKYIIIEIIALILISVVIVFIGNMSV